MHNASGPVRLLRGLNEGTCIACHSGGSNVSPAAPDVFTEFKKKGHPFPAGQNTHDASEAVLLNSNRHSTCADCHDSHASAAGEHLQRSADGSGFAKSDPGHQRDRRNYRPHPGSQSVRELPALPWDEFRQAIQSGLRIPAGARRLRSSQRLDSVRSTAKSAHPVMRPKGSSGAPQPSLLPTMLDLSGSTTHGRTMGTQIFCTDCHNSDDNREFGGAGPNGPHGSTTGTSLNTTTRAARRRPGPARPSPSISIPCPTSRFMGLTACAPSAMT